MKLKAPVFPVKKMNMSSNLIQIHSVNEMQDYSADLRREGNSVAFVPTMGALHRGHFKLIETAVKTGDKSVVSIFVNPKQFCEGEDFNEYKRDIEGDIEKLKKLGVDVVFTPSVNEVFPSGYSSYVEVAGLQDCLCGKFRSGHFKGVATVVLKLFNIVRPDAAVFGEKDYQQLKIIQKMVNDLNLTVRIVSVPIVREESGLALSSRNEYLGEEEKQRASSLYLALKSVKTSFDKGNRDVKKLVDIGVKILKSSGINDIDYLEIRDGETLGEVTTALPGNVVAAAVRLGNTRLIDNIKL